MGIVIINYVVHPTISCGIGNHLNHLHRIEFGTIKLIHVNPATIGPQIQIVAGIHCDPAVVNNGQMGNRIYSQTTSIFLIKRGKMFTIKNIQIVIIHG